MKIKLKMLKKNSINFVIVITIYTCIIWYILDLSNILDLLPLWCEGDLESFEKLSNTDLNQEKFDLNRENTSNKYLVPFKKMNEYIKGKYNSILFKLNKLERKIENWDSKNQKKYWEGWDNYVRNRAHRDMEKRENYYRTREHIKNIFKKSK